MRAALIACLLCPALTARADIPVVEGATAIRDGAGWRFSVTLSHPDTGWDHYADGWRVVAEDGTVLATRELLHPHVTEQPFTRSLGGVALQEGIKRVGIQARCNRDGWGKVGFWLDLGE
nr:hypothetical protein [Pseudoruegeria aquimaris]